MINGINHITLATKDVKESFKFYKDILGLKPLCKWDKGAYFLIGDMWFCLNYDEQSAPSTDYTHIAFNVKLEDFRIIKNKIISSSANIFKDNYSEGESLYFLDPDGHKLEIHIGSWQSRIESKKQDPGAWQNIEFFV
ncbi:MAG: fosA [Burkholderiales bacterium]|jgi:catechol 2,3-dioxygenase-like lactoylglutathione lyase family enzyme|nr:fosA [Burkholderiales bacterium]